jgi:hypothetical protein
LHVARRLLHVARRLLHVARRLLHVARHPLHVASRLLHVARRNMWPKRAFSSVRVSSWSASPNCAATAWLHGAHAGHHRPVLSPKVPIFLGVLPLPARGEAEHGIYLPLRRRACQRRACRACRRANTRGRASPFVVAPATIASAIATLAGEMKTSCPSSALSCEKSSNANRSRGWGPWERGPKEIGANVGCSAMMPRLSSARSSVPSCLALRKNEPRNVNRSAAPSPATAR